MLEIDKIFLAIMIMGEDLSARLDPLDPLASQLFSSSHTSAAPPFFDLVARLVSPGNKISIDISGRDFLRPVRESSPGRSLPRYYATKVARINPSRKGSDVMSCKFLIKRPTFDRKSHARDGRC